MTKKRSLNLLDIIIDLHPTDKNRSVGFTIVELLVIIVVISILATITIVSYRGISQKATEAAIISDLDSISKKFKLFQVENSTFPADLSNLNDCPIPAAGHLCMKLSPNNSYGTYYVDNSATPQEFCITIKSTNNAKSVTSDGIPMDGACPPINLKVVSKTTNSITMSWDAVSGAVGYKLQRSNTPDFASHADISTGSGTLTATSTGLAGGIYYYRVNATDPISDTTWSKTVSVTLLTILTYPTPGSYSWTVPAGTSSVQLEVWGGQGGNGGSFYTTPGGTGGLGGYAKGTLSVTSGQILSINVGQAGAVGSAGGDTPDKYGCASDFWSGGTGANGVESSIKIGATSELIGYPGTAGTGATASYTYDPDYSDYCYNSSGAGTNGVNGASYANTATLTAISNTTGVQSGDGKVVIIY